MISDKNPVHSYPCTSIDIFSSSCFFQDFPFVFLFYILIFVLFQCDVPSGMYVCVFYSSRYTLGFLDLSLVLEHSGYYYLKYFCSLSTFQGFNKVCVLPLDIMSYFLDVLFCFCFHAFFPLLAYQFREIL